MWAKNPGREEGAVVADVPPSEIVVPVANTEDGEEGGDDSVCCLAARRTHGWRVEGGGRRILRY